MKTSPGVKTVPSGAVTSLMNSARLQRLEVVDGEGAVAGVSDVLMAAGWIRTGVGEMAIMVGVAAAGVIGSGDGGTTTVTGSAWGAEEMALQAPNKKLRQSMAGQSLLV